MAKVRSVCADIVKNLSRDYPSVEFTVSVGDKTFGPFMRPVRWRVTAKDAFEAEILGSPISESLPAECRSYEPHFRIERLIGITGDDI